MKITGILDKYKVNGILVSNGYNMRYLSGFSGATGYLFISEKRKIILTDFRYKIQAEKESCDYEVIEITSDGYNKAINNIIHEENIECMGYEDEDMLVCDFYKLKKELDIKEWVPVHDELSRLRVIKTADEIEKIKKAESIGDIAFLKILDILKPGISEIEIAAELEYIMKKNGAERVSFDTIAASGINSSMPHAVPTLKKLQMGDFLTMDFGCVYEGYCSDMTRTVVIGKANEEQKKLYNTVLKAQLAALNFIKGGLIGREIDYQARKIIEDAGYRNCFGHGLGHSVGLYIHENPRLSPSESSIILPGTVETVEPGIYINGFGGVRIEDLVLVTEDGCVNFTHSEKGLIEL